MENVIKEFVNNLGGKVTNIECIRTTNGRKRYWVTMNCTICGKLIRKCWTYKSEYFCICSNHTKDSNKRVSYTEVKNFIEQYGCKLLSTEYVNNCTDLLIQCSCGNTFYRTFANFKHGSHTCRNCTNNRLRNMFRTPQDDVYEYVKSIGLSCLSDYVNSHEPLTLLCSEGHKFKRSYSVLKSSHECPICKGSIGLQQVIEWLSSHNIEFESEISFPNLLGIGGKPLHFDLGVRDINNNYVLIEYDGEFHFSPSQSESYEIIRVHDSIKNIYCFKNNIKLIRIPFFKLNSLDFLLSPLLNTEVNN